MLLNPLVVRADYCFTSCVITRYIDDRMGLMMGPINTHVVLSIPCCFSNLTQSLLILLTDINIIQFNFRVALKSRF